MFNKVMGDPLAKHEGVGQPWLQAWRGHSAAFGPSLPGLLRGWSNLLKLSPWFEI